MSKVAIQMPWKKHAAIGERLKQLRGDAGLSQREVAASAGLSLSVVFKIEQGVIPDPRIETLVALADALDIALDDLIGREQDLPPEPEPPAPRKLRGRRKRN